jgi:hypothetical protein
MLRVWCSGRSVTLIALIQNTYLSQQPTIQINRVPRNACVEHLRELDLSKDAIMLDEGYELASIFPQFLLPDALATLKSRELDPLVIPSEHNWEELESDKVLSQKHLHIIVEKPDIGEYIACS